MNETDNITDQDLMSVPQVMKFLRLRSGLSVHRKIQKHGWRHVKDGRRVLVFREDVEKHLSPILTSGKDSVE